jgi:NAD(P)-dependent dehydrogenase (short-subunit alcohol dehydrogenase family)
MNTITVITGANKGLGYETARQLGERGWTVLLGARNQDRGAEAAAKLAAEGVDVHLLQLDVTSEASVQAAATHVDATFGQLDVLVNNAGIGGVRLPPREISADQVRECYETNVFGPVRVTRVFLPLLDRSPSPRIVMVSSGMGSIGVTTDPARLESTIVSISYPSSKAALNMITTQYAKALPRYRVNAVDPGYTATDFNGHSGTQTVSEGAEAIVAMATVASDGPTGTFTDRHSVVPW